MSLEHPHVIFVTTLGSFTIELYPEKAPLTVANFLKYANENFYEGTIFHRVIDGFMIQGGGFTADMVQKKPRATIKNEANNGLSNAKGTIAMARSSEVDSATSQFFINIVDNPSLNHRGTMPGLFGYCVFGKVIAGMDVIDQIRLADTGIHGRHSDVPVETIEILEVIVE